MKKGEIWLVEFPSSKGHEQEGTRPVIILVETEANISVVVPLTSNIQALRYPHTLEIKPSKLNGLSSVSVALIFQLRAIDKSRLKRNIGDLDESTLKKLDKVMFNMLQL